MEKRFILFITLSAAILIGYRVLEAWLAPPQIAQQAPADGDDLPADPAGDDPAGDDPAGDDPAIDADEKDPPAEPPAADEPSQPPVENAAEEEVALAAPQLWTTLGSLDRNSGYPFLITFNSRGGAIERIELNSPRYLDIDDDTGYLGHLALTEVNGGGCQINVVGPGTPAALATPNDSSLPVGLQADDVIRALNGQPVATPRDFLEQLAKIKPRRQITLTVARSSGGAEREIQFTANLTRSPLQLIRPETFAIDGSPAEPTLSCLLTLETIGSTSIVGDAKEIKGIPSLRNGQWRLTRVDDDTIEFRYSLGPQALARIDQEGDLEIIRRYRTRPLALASEDAAGDSKPHRLEMGVEVVNHGAPLKVAYKLEGPNGLPLEGWWYTNKVHPTRFTSGGARDVAWRTYAGGHQLRTTNDVFKRALKDSTPAAESLLPERPTAEQSAFYYVGIDTLYFAAMIQPAELLNNEGVKNTVEFASAESYSLSSVSKDDKKRYKKTNVTFDLVSPTVVVEPGKPLKQELALFAGPKEPALLGEYGLGDLVVYGWFAVVAWVMVGALHLFHAITGNYGISIILLTILVRSLMFPISRKMAKNAARMQELAPEMKKINEKYTDMEKRSKAQQELWKKHGYNPLSGCLPMFLQLPVFIGLYKSLSVDIELRQRALIPGIDWCSNLAGPDMLFYWKPYLWDALGNEVGWLGPYLNILPLITVALFYTQQKLFTPPATDEQTKMTQQMMGFMTLFIGLMFFKVPSGLCIYFITSSIWGIGERLLLPKTKAGNGAADKPPAASKSNHSSSDKPSLLSSLLGKTDSNGNSPKERAQKRKKQRRK